MKSIWHKVRPYGRVFKALNGFVYDFKRFVLYGGWRENMYDIEQRGYHLVKVYHGLEKSISFKHRNKDSGWAAANKALELVRIAASSGAITFHDRAALKVLKDFVALPENIGTPKAIQMNTELALFDFESLDAQGAKEYSLEDFRKGVLQAPEVFFNSRYSLREFGKESVDEQTIKRAVELAMKSPSACNRHAWCVYHTSDPIIKEKALRYQEGHRGFGENIPNILIIAADLKAFIPGQERYQHWIDGGLFSMSIIYALHSLGVASCCLNWSQTPAKDKLLRSLVDINPSHTVIMLLAVGWPDIKNKVCISSRRPLEYVYKQLQCVKVRKVSKPS